jgi:phage I-like protein
MPVKKDNEYNKNCFIDLKLSNGSIGEDNISNEFVILEHKESDDFEYRNGFLSFKLSEKKLKQMASSFKNKERELYINYDHEADGSTLAAGWFREIRAGKSENGYALFAKAEWTPRAAEHIRNKEYVYFSAECRIEGMVAKLGDEVLFDPKIKKSVLTGGALTNNPYFKTTNLSLSSEDEFNTEDNMPDSAELNAEFEQFKSDKAAEILKLSEQIATFKTAIEGKDAEILKLSNEITEIKKANKDALIASFVNKLPEDAEKREAVKVKLEKLSEKLEGAEFSEMAELIIKENDKRITPANLQGEFKQIDEKAPLKPLAWDAFIQETKNEIKK